MKKSNSFKKPGSGKSAGQKKANARKPTGQNHPEFKPGSHHQQQTGTMSLADLLNQIYRQALEQNDPSAFLSSAARLMDLNLLDQKQLEQDLQKYPQIKEKLPDSLNALTSSPLGLFIPSVFENEKSRAEILGDPRMKRQINTLNGRMKKQVASKRMLQDIFECVLFDGAVYAESAAFKKTSGEQNISALLSLAKEPLFTELLSDAVEEAAQSFGENSSRTNASVTNASQKNASQMNASQRSVPQKNALQDSTLPDRAFQQVVSEVFLKKKLIERTGSENVTENLPAAPALQRLTGLIWLALTVPARPQLLYQKVKPHSWEEADFLIREYARNQDSDRLENLRKALKDSGLDTRSVESRQKEGGLVLGLLEAAHTNSVEKIEQSYKKLADFYVETLPQSAKQAAWEQLNVVHPVGTPSFDFAFQTLFKLYLQTKSPRQSKKLEKGIPAMKYASAGLQTAFQLKSEEYHLERDIEDELLYGDELDEDLWAVFPDTLIGIVSHVQNMDADDPEKDKESAGERMVRFLKKALEFLGIPGDLRDPDQHSSSYFAMGELIRQSSLLVKDPEKQKKLHTLFLEIFPEWKDRAAQSKSLAYDYLNPRTDYNGNAQAEIEDMYVMHTRIMEEFFLHLTDENWKILFPTSMAMWFAAESEVLSMKTIANGAFEWIGDDLSDWMNVWHEPSDEPDGWNEED